MQEQGLAQVSFLEQGPTSSGAVTPVPAAGTPVGDPEQDLGTVHMEKHSRTRGNKGISLAPAEHCPFPVPSHPKHLDMSQGTLLGVRAAQHLQQPLTWTSAQG